jgi:hypothetical protein
MRESEIRAADTMHESTSIVFDQYVLSLSKNVYATEKKKAVAKVACPLGKLQLVTSTRDPAGRGIWSALFNIERDMADNPMETIKSRASYVSLFSRMIIDRMIAARDSMNGLPILVTRSMNEVRNGVLK